MPRCAQQEPMLADVGGRLVACHLYDSAAYTPPVKVGAQA
jgi:hypothetical protein